MLIPHARNRLTGAIITAEDLLDMSYEDLAAIRIEAVQAKEAGEEALYPCPSCGHHMFPRQSEDRVRPHWTHFGNRPDYCKYEDVNHMSRDRLAAIIHRGRQETPGHIDLKNLIEALLQVDPEVEPGSLQVDQYLRPEGDGHGRYPDVRFRYAGRNVVMEAQLAPISLFTIAGRHQFYKENNATLLWVSRNFAIEPNLTWEWDVYAANNRAMFSIDDEVAAISRDKGEFHLRVIEVGAGKKVSSRIVALGEILSNRKEPGRAPPPSEAWSYAFKRRWEEAVQKRSYFFDADSLVTELEDKIPGLRAPFPNTTPLLRLINTLIALEKGKVVGSSQTNLAELVNTTLSDPDLLNCAGLLKSAILEFAPDLLQRPVTKRKMKMMFDNADGLEVEQLNRYSSIGKLRDRLFPSWQLKPTQLRSA